ncbi:MAG: cyclic nucleotide-binding domain-containing protein, partial [Planctomycetota bacterium]|nr:cyclic nucleotide-binding domain-containing protein [Planctomycetota bacterium]
GPLRLHYGLYQLRERHSYYLIARRKRQIAGGIGYMLDNEKKAVRVFELIARSDAPIRFLLKSLIEKCTTELGIEYVDLDVSAYSPRMQRTLLEMGFLPVSYVPANVFREVERLDAIRMVRLFVPFDLGELAFLDAMKPIAETVIKQFTDREVLPRIATASRQSPLFAGLSDEQRQRLLCIFSARSWTSGEALFRRGEADGTTHLVLEGDVRIDVDGREIARVRSGQCVGESSLLYAPESAPAHSADAIAEDAVETASFDVDEFRRFVRRHPDIGVVIYRNLAADVSEKLKRVRSIREEATESR